MKYVRCRLLITLVLILALGTVACGSPDPTFDTRDDGGATSGDGQILYAADGAIRLWDGTITDVITGGNAQSPRWSPDGRRIAYIEVAPEGYSDLIVVDRDGNGLRQVTENRPDEEPFSRRFVHFANWAKDPAWSPVGNQLIYVSDKDGWEVPYSEDPNDPQRLSDPLFLWYLQDWEIDPYLLPAAEAIGLPQEAPSFAPDGNTVAFVVRTEARVPQIWTLNLDTGETTVIVSDDGFDPAWSPGGAYIAYVHRTGGLSDIWLAPLDGSPATQITTIGTAVSPTWSPEGDALAFFRLSDETGEFEAWSIDISAASDGRISTSEPEKLFTDQGIDVSSGMSWH